MREKEPTLANVKDYIRLEKSKTGIVMDYISDHDLEMHFQISKDINKVVWERIQSRFYTIRLEGLDRYRTLFENRTGVTFAVAFRQMKESLCYLPFREFRSGYREPESIQAFWSTYVKMRNDSKHRFDKQDSYLEILLEGLIREVEAGLMTHEELGRLIAQRR